MSNLRNTTRLPLNKSMTKNWKSPALTNDLFERKTGALERSLNKLKLTMHRDTTKSNMEIYRPVLDTGISSTGSNRLSHSKVIQSAPIGNLASTKSSTIKRITKCGQCEKHEAKLKCLECAELYCANCFSHFHLRGALQRHRSILLSEKKEQQSLSVDNNLREVSHTQSKDELYRKSTMTPSIDESDEILDEKSRLTLYQQSFMQWRQNNNLKSERFKQKRDLKKKITSISDTTDHSIKLPNIECSSAKDELLLLHEDPSTDRNKREFLVQRSSRIHIRKKNQSELSQSLSENSDLNDRNSESEHLDDDLSTTRTEGSSRTMTAEEYSNNNNFEEQERPITHISTKSSSRSNSILITKDPISSRPASVTVFLQSLRSQLATKSNDELQAIVNSQSISSRPSSSVSDKIDQLPTIWNRKWKPEQSISNDTDKKPIVIDQYSINQFDLALDDLLDESKIETADRLNLSLENLPSISNRCDYPISSRTVIDKSSTHVSCVNSATTTPRRDSPFSFSYLLNKNNRITSSSSRDTGEGGFFTDVLPRQTIPSPIPPPPILECSTSNEWRHAPENQSRCPSAEQHRITPNLIPLRKSSIEDSSHVLSKHSVIVEETHNGLNSQVDYDSLSSASLPISITSSKEDFIDPNVASSRKKSLSPTATTKRSSPITKTSSSAKPPSNKSLSSAVKDSSPAATIPKHISLATTEKIPSATITLEKFSSLITKRTSPIPTTPKPTSTETLALQNSSSLTLERKKSSPPVVINDKKVTSPCDTDECLQESMIFIKDRSSSSQPTSQSLDDSLKTSTMILLNRDESINSTDLPVKKTSRRRRTITSDNEPSTLRKLGFSVGDGFKWQEVSTESMISTETDSTSRSSEAGTPSKPANINVAQEFTRYDNDDGCSSRTYQNINDEECFNQLCSEFGTTNSDEDTILNEHLLKILHDTQLPINDKGLTILELQPRESETSIDNKPLSSEEIRNL